MSDGRAWQGNWKARLYERVRERGYDSLTAFAEARPAVPLYVLAEELGKDDVAGVQVLSGLLAEAEQRKQVTRFVRDVLVRELCPEPPRRLAGRAGRRQPFQGRQGARLVDLPTPQKPIRSASSRPALRSSPRRRRPAGARSAPTTSCCARSCPTRKPDWQRRSS